MKYKFFRKAFLFVVLTIASCCPSGTDIYTIVKCAYNNGNDTIDFSEALCFEWDRMYWFPAGYLVRETLRYLLDETAKYLNGIKYL